MAMPGRCPEHYTMNWLERLGRHTGLMIHNIIHPDPRKQTRQVHKTVEEKKLDDGVTLRRTTIDEIEIRKTDNQQS